MKREMTIQEAGTMVEAKLDHRAKLAQHLAQQSKSKRMFHKLMMVLEVAGLAFIIGHLALAFYVSFNWAGVPERIAAIWLALPASFTAVMILVGLHAAGLRAFFPIALPGGPQEFTTGSKAVGMGLGFAAVCLVAGAFWGAFAWGVWTVNWAILEPLTHIIAVVAGVGVTVAVAWDLYKRFIRS
jgi:hypothetical protein